MLTYKEKLKEWNKHEKGYHKKMKPIYDKLVAKSNYDRANNNKVDISKYPPCSSASDAPVLQPNEVVEVRRDRKRIEDIAKINAPQAKIIKGIEVKKEPGKPGSGKGNNIGSILVQPGLRLPKWIRDLKSNIANKIEKKWSRKDMDHEAASYYGVIRKSKKKVVEPRDSLYILLDTSGSMMMYKDENGNTLLDLVAMFFPALAEEFDGEIWFSDDLPANQRVADENRVNLERFKKTTTKSQAASAQGKYLNISGGGGSGFDGAFCEFKDIEKDLKKKNGKSAIAQFVFLSDMEISITADTDRCMPENILFVTALGHGESVKKYVDKSKTRHLVYADIKKAI